VSWSWSPSMLRTEYGPAIAYQVVPSANRARARVVLLHGRSEYAYRYRPAVEAWSDRGIAVAAMDLRGHGDSEGVRGHIDRFDDYLDDVHRLLDRCEKEPSFAAPSAPVLFGHSLGALIAIHTALRSPRRIRGLVLSSPFLGLSLPVPAVERAAAVAFSRVWPTFSRPPKIRGWHVTADPEMAEACEHDARLTLVATARWYTETKKAQARALALASSLAPPVYCAQAGDELVASVAATQAFMRRVPGSRCEIVPGARHEILNDRDRETWMQKFADVILSMSEPQRAAETAS
jgi:alpha-beta hydrolase superfamily lysophospholipase